MCVLCAVKPCICGCVASHLLWGIPPAPTLKSFGEALCQGAGGLQSICPSGKQNLHTESWDTDLCFSHDEAAARTKVAYETHNWALSEPQRVSPLLLCHRFPAWCDCAQVRVCGMLDADDGWPAVPVVPFPYREDHHVCVRLKRAVKRVQMNEAQRGQMNEGDKHL